MKAKPKNSPKANLLYKLKNNTFDSNKKIVPNIEVFLLLVK